MMPSTAFNTFRTWWHGHVIRDVNTDAVLSTVHDDTGWSGRYAFMILMSAGIAVLGLLQSSPAVVIGAMLVSPLMGPIIGLGFAVATFDAVQLRRSVAALAGGTFLAVAFCALIVVMSPLQNVTAEISARTRPNLFDLGVALFSALAGAYATIRGRSGTIVGVAIATALMPPLAVVGFGLATANWSVFIGSLLLFFTNLMTIALAAATMARIYGFGPRLSPHQTFLQSLAMATAFIALAIPLGITLRHVAAEAFASRQAKAVLDAEFGGESRVSQVDIDYDASPIAVDATIFTPRYHADASKRMSATLTQLLGQPVNVKIEQYRVSTGAVDAQAGQSAGGANAANADRETQELADRLALIAGVEVDAVTIDRPARRAIVAAQPLPGATIATYRTLETRVAASAGGWDVVLTPPLVPLGPVSVSDGTPDADTLADAAWAAARVRLPVTVSGPKAPADAAEEILRKAGVTVVGGPSRGPLRLAWSVPDSAAR